MKFNKKRIAALAFSIVASIGFAGCGDITMQPTPPTTDSVVMESPIVAKAPATTQAPVQTTAPKSTAPVHVEKCPGSIGRPAGFDGPETCTNPNIVGRPDGW